MVMTSQLVEKGQRWNPSSERNEKYEVKKQVIGEDPDPEKSRRILNRVIKWNHNGVTIEADQRHVREILKGLELEQANRSATPCGVERTNEGKGETRCRPRLSTSGFDRDRPRMVEDNDPDSQALTNDE